MHPLLGEPLVREHHAELERQAERQRLTRFRHERDVCAERSISAAWLATDRMGAAPRGPATVVLWPCSPVPHGSSDPGR